MGPPETSSHPDQQVFVSRSPEIAKFRALLRQVNGGSSRVLLVTGEPGIGKTALAEHCEAMARTEGAAVAWGRWTESIPYPEYWVWRQVLQRLLRSEVELLRDPHLGSAFSELTVLVPDLQTRVPDLAPPLQDSDRSRRHRLAEAVCRILGKACGRRPLLLVLDNLHIAGQASLSLTGAVLDYLAREPLLLLAAFRDLPAYRSGAFAVFLDNLKPSLGVQEMRLEGLGSQAVAQLVEGLAGVTLPQSIAQELTHRTRGNPLFVKEFARLLRSQHESSGQGIQALWTSALPEAIETLISRRFQHLSPDAAETLRRAAVIGEVFDTDTLGLLSPDQGANQTESQLEEAVAYGIVHRADASGPWRFSHNVIWESVRCSLPDSRRAEISAALAAAVARAHAGDIGPWALRLAQWFAAGGGPEAAARRREYLVLAAEHALGNTAWEEAIHILREVVGDGIDAAATAEQAHALRLLGRAYAAAGDWPAAVRSMRAAFEFHKRRGDVRSMLDIATIPVFLNPGEPGFYDYFGEIIPLLPPDAPERGMVLCLCAFAQFNSMADYDGAETTLTKARDLAFRTGDVPCAARSLVLLAVLHLRHYRFNEAIQTAEGIPSLLARQDDPLARAPFPAILAWAHKGLGRPEAALASSLEALRQEKRSRNGYFIAAACQQAAHYQADRGDFAAARRTSDEGLEAAPDNTILLAFRCFLEYTVGEFEAGDAYRRRILDAQRRVPEGPYHVHIHAIATELLRAYHAGDPAPVGHVPALRSIVAHPEAHPYIAVRARLLLAWVAAMADDPVLAREAYRALREPPELNLVRPYYVSRFMGLAAHCFGDHQRAVRHLTKALELCMHYGDQPLEAWIRYELGRALLGPDSSGARAQLRRSLAQAKRLGLAPLCRRVGEPLASLRATRTQPTPLEAHLSAREHQVLAEMAEGRSNEAIGLRLSISANTVANHVHHILSKTGARSRTEALAVARRLGLLR